MGGGRTVINPQDVFLSAYKNLRKTIPLPEDTSRKEHLTRALDEILKKWHNALNSLPRNASFTSYPSQYDLLPQFTAPLTWLSEQHDAAFNIRGYRQRIVDALAQELGGRGIKRDYANIQSYYIDPNHPENGSLVSDADEYWLLPAAHYIHDPRAKEVHNHDDYWVFAINRYTWTGGVPVEPLNRYLNTAVSERQMLVLPNEQHFPYGNSQFHIDGRSLAPGEFYETIKLVRLPQNLIPKISS